MAITFGFGIITPASATLLLPLLILLLSLAAHPQSTVLGFHSISIGRVISSTSHASGSSAAAATTTVKMAPTIQEINTPEAPAPLGPYSQAVLVRGSTLYVSGQIALDPKTGELVGHGDVQAEARQALANLGEVLKAAGAGPQNVVRCTVFLQDLNDFASVNEIYADFFKDSPVAPSRSCVQVAKLPKGVAVEIDAIAEL
jgi:reactive intermediate/imine deaminase